MSRQSPLSTTLRQKLSNLASPVAPSFSSSPATFSPTSLGPAKKRGLFASLLRGKSADNEAAYAGPSPKGKERQWNGSKERQWDAGELDEGLQNIMNAVIFNGGLDFETRPLVVVTAAALPNPLTVNYDVLLQLILSYLDLYVEADYTVVFLAAGGRYSPGWSWIWKAYRSLNRKYRKNLKKLYIVHSTGFSKMLFSLAGAIISPKFYSKIEYVSTLSDLARHVPINQMNIHPAVYSENLKYEREITLPPSQQSESRVFGIPLDELMGADGESGGIPRPVKEAITYLRSEKLDGTTPLSEQGLFRRSPSSTRLRQVQECYDRGQIIDLSQFGDANLAAVLIKKYFRALPEPIFPETTFGTIRRCPNPNVEENHTAAIEYIREKILGELEGNKQVLLNVVFQLLHDVALRSADNLMDAYNLAIVFTPNLVSNENPLRAIQMSMVAPPPTAPTKSRDIISLSSQESIGSAGPGANEALTSSGSERVGGTTLGTIVRTCIENYYEIFDEVRDVTEVVPEDNLESSVPGLSSTKAGSFASSRKVASPPASPEVAKSPSKPGARTPPPIPPRHRDTGTSEASSPSQPYKYQPRVRGHAGPPPSAASASMALLAKALADSSQSVPHESSPLMEGSQSRSYSGGVDSLPSSSQPSTTYINSRSNTGDSSGVFGAQSVSVRSGAGAASGSGWTGGRGTTGLPKTRSIISIEKSTPTVTGEAFSGRESIRLGRGKSGTVRKSASAGVVGVGVTASGFFTSPGSGS